MTEEADGRTPILIFPKRAPVQTNAPTFRIVRGSRAARFVLQAGQGTNGFGFTDITAKRYHGPKINKHITFRCITVGTALPQLGKRCGSPRFIYNITCTYIFNVRANEPVAGERRDLLWVQQKTSVKPERARSMGISPPSAKPAAKLVLLPYPQSRKHVLFSMWQHLTFGPINRLLDFVKYVVHHSSIWFGPRPPWGPRPTPSNLCSIQQQQMKAPSSAISMMGNPDSTMEKRHSPA